MPTITVSSVDYAADDVEALERTVPMRGKAAFRIGDTFVYGTVDQLLAIHHAVRDAITTASQQDES